MLERVTWRGVWKRVEGWVRWSDPGCGMSRKPSPMSPSLISGTVANGLVGDSLFCDVVANLHSHLAHEVDLERVVEMRDLAFSELCGGCGFRWLYWW
jgi:hypothetical protein